MRIHYLSNSLIPSRAANAVQVMRMCEALARRGHEVTLFARSGQDAGDPYATYGVTPCFDIAYCRRPAAGPAGALAYAVEVRRAVGQRRRADLFYSRHAWSLAAAAGPLVPVVFEAHQAPAFLDGILEGRLFRRRNFARLVTISEALRREYLRRYPALPPVRVQVAHDAAEPFGERAIDPVELRRSTREPRLRVGYIGQLYAGKGMEVVSALARRRADVDFHVVGGDEAELRHWRQATSGSENLFFYGHVAAAHTAAYVQSMDVLLAPYQTRVAQAGGDRDIGRWMSPLKIFEYMAGGKAIVASDLPVIREILQNGVTALLVAPADLDAWGAALVKLEEVATRQRLGAAAADVARRLHTWSARAARVLEGIEHRGGPVTPPRPKVPSPASFRGRGSG